MSALLWAASEGHTDTARLLLDNGADVNKKSKVSSQCGVRSQYMWSEHESAGDFSTKYICMDVTIHSYKPQVWFLGLKIISLKSCLYGKQSSLSPVMVLISAHLCRPSTVMILE